MRTILSMAFLFTLSGCSSYPVDEASPVSVQEASAQQVYAQQINEQQTNAQQCLGNTDLPKDLQDSFEAVNDEELLQESLGEPTKGKLCQGQVYKSKGNSQVTIFRAWNSTNPNSKLGKWWTFQEPVGDTSIYRADYEICYQWSPLDRLVHCELKPGTKIVLGTGQSAECSQYLTYPVSAKQQVFIAEADGLVTDCEVLTAEFNWK